MTPAVRPVTACRLGRSGLVTAMARTMVRSWTKRSFGSFGHGSTFDPLTSRISGHENFHIGSHVFIGAQATLSADGVRVEIGDDTIIGPGFCREITTSPVRACRTIVSNADAMPLWSSGPTCGSALARSSSRA